MNTTKIAILTLTLFVIFSTAAFATGPFGLEMGMSLKEIDANAKQVAPGKYVTTKVPKPHSAFDRYVVQVGKKNGLSWIKGIGKNISTNGYGLAPLNAFDIMDEKLTNQYKTGEKTNFIVSGGIWSEPQYFMMSLLKNERFFMKIWKTEHGSELKNNIKKVGLLIIPQSQSVGHLALEYYFSNGDACNKEIAALEDGAL